MLALYSFPFHSVSFCQFNGTLRTSLLQEGFWGNLINITIYFNILHGNQGIEERKKIPPTQYSVLPHHRV